MVIPFISYSIEFRLEKEKRESQRSYQMCRQKFKRFDMCFLFFFLSLMLVQQQIIFRYGNLSLGQEKRPNGSNQQLIRNPIIPKLQSDRMLAQVVLPFIKTKSFTCFISRSLRLIMYDDSTRAQHAPPVPSVLSSPTKPPA